MISSVGKLKTLLEKLPPNADVELTLSNGVALQIAKVRFFSQSMRVEIVAAEEDLNSPNYDALIQGRDEEREE